MKITIAHISARLDPKWEWFVDALFQQTTANERAALDLIFIDRHAWTSYIHDTRDTEVSLVCRDWTRFAALDKIIGGRLEFRHIGPLPNLYQGPFRQTKQDWFNAGVNRNTAIVAARGDYIMFCDDLSLPMPRWWRAVKRGAEYGWLLAGQYKKVTNLRVQNGLLLSHDDFPPGVDSRWGFGSDTAPVPWHGSAVYGCSFGAPLEMLLGADGNGIECACQGGEDYDLGMRMHRAGAKVMLDRTCLTLESEEDHHREPSLPRQRVRVIESALPQNYRTYQVAREEEMYMSDHVVLNRLSNETSRVTPIFPNNLRAVRAQYHATGLVPIPKEPTTDWRTGQPLKDL